MKVVNRVAAVALLMVGSQPKAEAMPVIDAAHITQAILNTADQLRQWGSYIREFREQAAMFGAVYMTVKDWKSLDFQDILGVVEMPWFDGIDGIEDIRNVANAAGMSVEELQTIFKEVKMLQRMRNDPLYRENQIYAARCKLWTKVYARVMKRRIVITRAHQTHINSIEAMQKKRSMIHARLTAEMAKDTPSQSAISGLQTQLNIIDSKLSSQEKLWEHQYQAMVLQEQAELEGASSESEAMTNTRFDDSDKYGNPNWWAFVFSSGARR